VGLYHVNYRVKERQEELKRVERDIKQERERLHVLEAEWSYLNRPSRLARLARKHLDMETLQPEQIVRVEQLPPRITRREMPRPDGPDARGDGEDSVPLPRAKPWSLEPQLSAATPFAPGEDAP
jgi:cell division protein FtsL